MYNGLVNVLKLTKKLDYVAQMFLLQCVRTSGDETLERRSNAMRFQPGSLITVCESFVKAKLCHGLRHKLDYFGSILEQLFKTLITH